MALKRYTCLLLIVPHLFWSCKKDMALMDQETYSTSKYTVLLKCDNQSVFFDSINNTNLSGNKYSIHNVNFYISNIKLMHEDGSVFSSKETFYIDPLLISKNSFYLDSIPAGNYTEITFLLGLDPMKNIDFGLATTLDNLNMAWPTAMGGGYHFLKMEGHYLDTMNQNKGYAIHLGKNENAAEIKLHQLFIQKNQNHDFTIVFNVNEVFANPYTYNLNFETNYTMADSLSMLKIRNNIQDAFSIIQNN